MCFNVKVMSLFFQMHLLVVESLSYIFCAVELELFLYQTKGEMSPLPSFGKILNSSLAYLAEHRIQRGPCNGLLSVCTQNLRPF